MTFLNPLALFALAAAAIPLIVHLFNFRRPRRVEFSSLVFLRELERSTMQRVRIQQWLLLLLRTLAIAFLVLAFARPTLTGQLAGALGDTGTTAVAIVVDNSMSMETLERQGERFRSARDAALHIIEAAGASDEIFVVSTSDGTVSQQPLRKAAAAEAIAAMDIRPYSRPLALAIREGADLLGGSATGTGDVFVLSDLQRTTLHQLPEDAVEHDVAVTLVPVGQRVAANIAVTEVNVVSRIVDAGQPVRVEATLHNFGADEVVELPVSVYVGEERVAQSAASIPAGGPVQVPFVFTPRERGWLEGRVIVDDEVFRGDNERFFSILIPERRRLLIVRGAGTGEHVVLALSPEVSGGRVVFDRQVIPAASLSTQTLGEYDAVVLGGMPSFSSGEIGSIVSYVQDGGGVMIYPGSRADLSSYSELFSRLGGGSVEGMAGSAGSAEAIARIGAADLDHPVFEGVFEGDGEARLEEADVFAAIRYMPRGASEQTILSLSNGWPFLHEIRAGAGSVFVLASAPDPAWTELSVRGLFVPLLYRSLFYLSASETDMGDGMLLSEDATVRLVDRAGGAAVHVMTPTGEEIVPEQRQVFGTRRVELVGRQLGAPGFARLVDPGGGAVRHVTAVNVDPAESDPALTPPAEAASMLEEALEIPVRTLAVDGDMTAFGRALSAARTGVEIWNVFLLVALGFLVAEMLVAKRWRPEIEPA